MKTQFFAAACTFLLASSASAQAPETARATDVVKNFYRFDLSHEQSFNAQQIESRSRFFTPKMRRLFWAELKREQKYAEKHPTDKPQFTQLPFQPIEFHPQDLRVGAAQIRRSTASVTVDFGSRPPVSYRILLIKSGEKWLLDDVIYDDASRLSEVFTAAAKLR